MLSSAPADPSLIDSRQAAWRLLVTLGLVVLGNSSMYVVAVVLPTVQAEFGIGRAEAAMPYTLMMVCLGLGGIWTGRLADRHGLMPVLWVGALAVCGGFVWAGLSGSIWAFGLAHGLLGFIGSSSTFAPLLADTALWWNRRRGIAVAVCASGNYIAGAIWPPIVQHGIETIGWRHTYMLLGLVCGLGVFALSLRMRLARPWSVLHRRVPGPRCSTAVAHSACVLCRRSSCFAWPGWPAAWRWPCPRSISWPIAQTWALAPPAAPRCSR